MSKIALVDLSGIHRGCWHASAGSDISDALSRTVSIVTASIAGFDHIGICMDAPPYLRCAIAGEYKKTREAQPDALYEQLRQIEATLSADGHHIFKSKGYEADDLLAQIALWGEAAGHEVVIYSADKDLLGCVTEKVAVVSTATRVRYGPKEVLEKMGVRPDQVHDLLALMGDSSDNIPGIPGVGKKTAAAWLTEHGSLEGVMVNVKKLPLRFQELIEAHRVDIKTSWKLTQPMLDSPIKPEIIMEAKEKTVTKAAPAVEIPDEPEVVDAPKAERGIMVKDTDTTAMEPTGPWDKALEPKTAAQAWGIATALFKSRMFGQFANPEAVLAIIMTGRTMGLDAVTSLRSFHMIEGKACPHAHLLIGLVKRSPECEYFRLVSSGPEEATYETKRRGDPEPTTLTYTIGQANAAGLKGGNWVKRPDEMIRKTCAVQLARVVYPDCTAGIYAVEEMGQ